MFTKILRTISMLFLGLAVCLGWARADQQELQFGYVFDAWNSNSLVHGSEHRIPLAYYFSSGNLSLSLNTAFLSGDYVQDSDPVNGIIGSEFKSSQFSDTSLGAGWGFDMGAGIKSSLTGNLNIPTGDNRWELEEQTGTVPYIFEPTYYQGRGWGGNLFYTLTASSNDVEFGLGGGYMSTSQYDTVLSAEGTYNPGDSIAALGTFGFRLSPADIWGFRFVRSFPLESTYSNANQDFTEDASSIITTQWTSQWGGDKLVLNVSYSFYNAGSTAQPTPPYSLTTDPGAYFGDHLQIHPILGYGIGKGAVMETGILWDWIQPNGYPQAITPGSANLYEGGGNLFGAEQSITIQLSPATFWSLAGLYHYIENANAGENNQGTITYQRFTVGMNMGVKW